MPSRVSYFVDCTCAQKLHNINEWAGRQQTLTMQVVTTGSDRKIAYWDAYDGSAVRVTDASDDAAVCDVHVDAEGEAIVSCGADSLVQLWGYDEGHCFYTGVGHSGTVNRVRVSPDRTHVVSVGSEGGIFVWKYKSPAADEPAAAAGG